MTARVRRWSDVEARRKACCPRASAAAAAAAAPASLAAPRRSSEGNVVTVSSMSPPPSTGGSSSAPPFAEVEAEECVICLDELVGGRALFLAECGHKFHFSCLLENVNHDEANSDKCPICRKPQTQWPEQTKGLVKAHPFCTNCGRRGCGGQFCDGCGHSLAHTPTAAERARAAAAAAAARSNVVVECPTCRIRCLVSTSARGTLQCPNGHLFQVRMPAQTTRNSLMGPGSGGRASYGGAPPPPPASRPVMRQCSTCYTRVQMPPGSQAGQYMCPLGHTFYYDPHEV
ncbi:hypothetical protein ATCC90586_000461 [Pythium insidiosum]|nr:hypothetical protein ATCC90586_000461 [Pythium insidiosum]